MRLIYWPTCPYACKVIGVLSVIGLEGQVEKIPLHPWQAGSPISDHNPLKKIPILINEYGDYFYDSRVICEYLDERNPGEKLIPPSKSNKRWEVLRLQALADGINDALILKLTEENVRASNLQSIKWMRRQQSIVEKTLNELEKLSPTFYEDNINLGLIAISSTLGYLSYRYGPSSWRGTHPQLSNWHATMLDSPLYLATLPNESYPLPENMESLTE